MYTVQVIDDSYAWLPSCMLPGALCPLAGPSVVASCSLPCSLRQVWLVEEEQCLVEGRLASKVFQFNSRSMFWYYFTLFPLSQRYFSLVRCCYSVNVEPHIHALLISKNATSYFLKVSGFLAGALERDKGWEGERDTFMC